MFKKKEQTGVGIGICPKDLQDLMSNYTEDIVDALNKGMSVMIDPKNWGKNAADDNSSDEECDCPVCRARRAAYEHFKDKYSVEQIDEFLDADSNSAIPADLEDFLNDKLVESTDEATGGMLKEIAKPENLIDAAEVSNDLAASRSDIDKIDIKVHITRTLDEGKLVIMKAPSLMKIVKPDAPNYLIVGNLSKEDEERLIANCKSYRWTTAFIQKYGSKALGGSRPDVEPLIDALKSILN